MLYRSVIHLHMQFIYEQLIGPSLFTMTIATLSLRVVAVRNNANIKS